MFTRWFGRRRKRTDLRFVMYTRQGCHLCDDAWEELMQLQADYGFQLEKVDIDADPDLQQQHSESVPVVAVNGKVRFRGPLNVVLVRRLLRAGS